MATAAVIGSLSTRDSRFGTLKFDKTLNSGSSTCRMSLGSAGTDNLDISGGFVNLERGNKGSCAFQVTAGVKNTQTLALGVASGAAAFSGAAVEGDAVLQAAQAIRVSNGGATDAATFDTVNKWVGIATNTPKTALHVTGRAWVGTDTSASATASDSGSQLSIAANQNDAASQIQLNKSNVGAYFIGMRGTSNPDFRIGTPSTNPTFAFVKGTDGTGAGGTEIFSIGSSGQMGIGMAATSPYTLSVGGSALFQSDNTHKFTIDPAGDVNLIAEDEDLNLQAKKRIRFTTWDTVESAYTMRANFAQDGTLGINMDHKVEVDPALIGQVNIKGKTLLQSATGSGLFTAVQAKNTSVDGIGGGEFLSTTGTAKTSAWGLMDNSRGAFWWVNGGDRINIDITSGNIGLGGVTSAKGELQFKQDEAKRKLVLNQVADNDHQFTGVGKLSAGQVFQVAATSESHLFYAAASSSASNKLLEIYGSGKVGIAGAPAEADLTFPASNATRRINLYPYADNDFQFAGLGVSAAAFESAIPTSSYNYIWYAGASSTSRDELLRLDGTGKIGIRGALSAADLTFPNASKQRKIALATVADNDHDFFGFGTNSGVLRYQTCGSLANSHVWYHGTSSTTSTEVLRVDGSGKVAIRGASRQGDLNFPAEQQDRKIVLFPGFDNVHQFIGFGVNSSQLRYRVDTTSCDNVWYAATSSTASNELFRVAGSGKLSVRAAANAGGDLTFPGEAKNRKVVLWPHQDNEYEFIGLGAESNKLVYNINSGASSHVFTAASAPGVNGALGTLATITGTGRLLLRGATAGGDLVFPSEEKERKINLFSLADNDHQFAGIGKATGQMTYHIPATADSNVWYAGTSSTASAELMRLTGGGRLGIGVSSPTSTLAIAGNMEFVDSAPSLIVGGGSGTLRIEGSIQLTGSLDSVSRTDLHVVDKQLIAARVDDVAVAETDYDLSADQGGLVIANNNYYADGATEFEKTETSLLWKKTPEVARDVTTDIASTAVWELRGGALMLSKIIDGTRVSYTFDIASDESLQLYKSEGSSGLGVAITFTGALAA